MCGVRPTSESEVRSHLRLSTVPCQWSLYGPCYQLRVTLLLASQAALIGQSSGVERRWLTHPDALLDVEGEEVSVHGKQA